MLTGVCFNWHVCVSCGLGVHLPVLTGVCFNWRVCVLCARRASDCAIHCVFQLTLVYPVCWDSACANRCVFQLACVCSMCKAPPVSVAPSLFSPLSVTSSAHVKPADGKAHDEQLLLIGTDCKRFAPGMQVVLPAVAD